MAMIFRFGEELKLRNQPAHRDDFPVDRGGSRHCRRRRSPPADGIFRPLGQVNLGIQSASGFLEPRPSGQALPGGGPGLAARLRACSADVHLSTGHPKDNLYDQRPVERAPLVVQDHQDPG